MWKRYCCEWRRQVDIPVCRNERSETAGACGEGTYLASELNDAQHRVFLVAEHLGRELLQAHAELFDGGHVEARVGVLLREPERGLLVIGGRPGVCVRDGGGAGKQNKTG